MKNISGTEKIAGWTTNEEVTHSKKREINHAKNDNLSDDKKSEIVNNLKTSLDFLLNDFSKANEILHSKHLYDAIVSIEESKRSLNKTL